MIYQKKKHEGILSNFFIKLFQLSALFFTGKKNEKIFCLTNYQL